MNSEIRIDDDIMDEARKILCLIDAPSRVPGQKFLTEEGRVEMIARAIQAERNMSDMREAAIFSDLSDMMGG